jgi:hypothetical protein
VSPGGEEHPLLEAVTEHSPDHCAEQCPVNRAVNRNVVCNHTPSRDSGLKLHK